MTLKSEFTLFHVLLENCFFDVTTPTLGAHQGMLPVLLLQMSCKALVANDDLIAVRTLVPYVRALVCQQVALLLKSFSTKLASIIAHLMVMFQMIPKVISFIV